MINRGTHAERPSRLVMARSRGAVTGPLLMLLGAWGALVPFIGHSFGYGFTPDNTWAWTAARGWLEVLPGAAAFLGGALLTVSAHRVSAMVGGWIAAVSGAWFALGTTIGPFWSAGNIGVPTGSGHHAAFEQLGMFSGLGVAIVFLAAVALGRVSVIGVRDVSAAQARIDSDRDAEILAMEQTDRPVRTVTLPDAEPADTTAAESTNSESTDADTTSDARATSNP